MTLGSSNHLVVGIADMKFSNHPDDVLVTYSLGSCVGLVLYDPEACVGGMVHCMLPLSRTDPVQAKSNPAKFTDTGVSTLLQTIYDMGGRKDRLIAKVAGGGAARNENMFRIGERNYTVLRKILWKNDILLAGEDVGGNKPRTMYLHMTDGRTIIKSGGQETEL